MPNKDAVLILSTLFLAAAALWVCETALARPGLTFYRNFTQTREAIVLKKQMAINERSTPADVLFLGDSTVDAAIDESVFEAHSGLRCANLGLVGDLVTYGDYRMLREYLARHGAPRAIVVWHTVDVWQRSLNLGTFGFSLPSPEDRRTAFAAGFKNIEWTPGVIHRPIKLLSQAWEGTLYSLSRTYRFKVWLKKTLAQWLPGVDPVGLTERLEQSQPAAPRDTIKAQKGNVLEQPILISKDCDLWFGKLVMLSREHGIRVFFARSPIHEAFVQDPGTARYLAQLNAKLDQWLLAYPDVTPLHRTNPVFEAREGRGDKDHVGPLGRDRITRDYAVLLRKALH